MKNTKSTFICLWCVAFPGIYCRQDKTRGLGINILSQMWQICQHNSITAKLAKIKHLKVGGGDEDAQWKTHPWVVGFAGISWRKDVRRDWWEQIRKQASGGSGTNKQGIKVNIFYDLCIMKQASWLCLFETIFLPTTSNTAAIGLYLCSAKTGELLKNSSPMPERFPETWEISRGQREISKVKGNLPVNDEIIL